MPFKLQHVLLGFSAFLLAYSLDNTSEVWYAVMLGFAVFLYYCLPRKTLFMVVYLFLGGCVALFIDTSNSGLVFLFLLAVILSVIYPWLRGIPRIKILIISFTWTLFMVRAIPGAKGLNLIFYTLILLLVFSFLAIASDVNDRETDPDGMLTIPQVTPWPILRWVLLSALPVLVLITFLFVPNWLVGIVFFNIFSSVRLFKNWERPDTLELDPGLLLFAIGNLLYAR
jgi:hypothetical protein